MRVSDKSIKSDLGVDICVRLCVLKLPQITACYHQCWANRRQFAFGWWAISKVSPWCRRRRGRVFFPSYLTYAREERRMKEKEMRSEGSRRQVQNRREGGVILHSLRTEGWRWGCAEMRWIKKKKTEQHLTRMAEEEDSCALSGRRAGEMERLHCGSSASILISL